MFLLYYNHLWEKSNALSDGYSVFIRQSGLPGYPASIIEWFCTLSGASLPLPSGSAHGWKSHG
jgi:hypothetical protein